MKLFDPLRFRDEFWPTERFYDKQVEMCYSVRDNVETVVVAGNKLGKDYITGFIVLWFFLSSLKLGIKCRVITTSVDEAHLIVLWSEIARFLRSAKYPLLERAGGPLYFNHMEIRKVEEIASTAPESYVIGRVSKTGEGLAGHHAPRTLAVIDEASGVCDNSYNQILGWAQRRLIFGNPNKTTNFFRRAVKGGDIVGKTI